MHYLARCVNSDFEFIYSHGQNRKRRKEKMCRAEWRLSANVSKLAAHVATRQNPLCECSVVVLGSEPRNTRKERGTRGLDRPATTSTSSRWNEAHGSDETRLAP